MIEHPFQINITVLNKCTSIPWQAHQTSLGSQKQAIRSYSFKGNRKKDARAGGLHSSGVQEKRARIERIQDRVQKIYRVWPRSLR